MFVCCDCCVLSGRGLCDELIIRPEESYRLWCVVVCDLENLKNEEAMTRVGSQRHRKYIYIYIYRRCCIWLVDSVDRLLQKDLVLATGIGCALCRKALHTKLNLICVIKRHTIKTCRGVERYTSMRSYPSR